MHRIKNIFRNEVFMEPFHKRLRRLREKRELSVKAMASQIQVPESTYREWEYGRKLAGPPYIRVAEVLAVPLSYLMSGHENEASWLLERLEFLEEEITRLRVSVSSRS